MKQLIAFIGPLLKKYGKPLGKIAWFFISPLVTKFIDKLMKHKKNDTVPNKKPDIARENIFRKVGFVGAGVAPRINNIIGEETISITKSFPVTTKEKKDLPPKDLPVRSVRELVRIKTSNKDFVHNYNRLGRKWN